MNLYTKSSYPLAKLICFFFYRKLSLDCILIESGHRHIICMKLFRSEKKFASESSVIRHSSSTKNANFMGIMVRVWFISCN